MIDLYFYKSISSSSFFNKIFVGKNINKESIEAKMEDNKLKITFVKSEDDQKRIEIKIK
jgi:HSP20 family molecular chaperone IbpA